MSPNSTNIASSSKTLVSALKLSFERFGTSVAVDAPTCSLTYAELDVLTVQIAAKLRQQCGQQRLKSQPIAILMSRSLEFYVAQVAILRAGGFFLPIDPSQPTERIEFLLSDSQASLLLVREGDSLTIPQSSATPFPIDVGQWKESNLACDGESLVSTAAVSGLDEADEGDLAYMIYTSGSSGQPKGVPIAHQSILHLCDWWSEEFEISHGERASQIISVGFDASLEEIFPTLITGGTVVPVQPDALSSTSRLLNFIKRQRIRNLHLPTALFHSLVLSLETHPSLELPSSVRTVVFGGEKVEPGLIESWFSRVESDIRLINAYGPTEATVTASYAVLRPGEQPSIGKPIREVSFYVVGEDGQLVEAGQPGELYIAGIGLAKQYWRREQLSAEKFVASPLADGQMCYRTGDLVRLDSHGNYEFVGRIDDQVKLRGYRIEPGEISSCLGTHPRVSQTHVVARRLATGNSAQSLVGYVVSKANEELSEQELKDFLSQRLPAYMVPANIVQMDSFPITAGGKLDLDRFPNPDVNRVSTGDDVGEPRLLTATEQKISSLWEKVLGVSGLGRDANFFHAGGNSLSAMQLVLLLESEFPGLVIPVVALIPNPSIASMAEYIDQRKHSSEDSVPDGWPLLTRLGSSDDPIRVVCLHAAGGGGMFYRQLYESVEQTVPIAVLESSLLYQDGPVVCDQQSITEIAQRYVDCLVEAGCDQQLTLVGYSFGGLLAFEMAQAIKLRGYQVKQIINIDSPNPQSITPRSFLTKLWCRLRLPGSLSQRLDHFKGIALHKWKLKKVQRQMKAGRTPSAGLRPLALEVEFAQLAKEYAPQPCDVPMHLIRGEELEPVYLKPDDYGWKEYVSELTVTIIPGGHHSIFTKPYVEDLKEAFRKSLIA